MKLAMSIPASQGWLLAVLGRLRKNFLLKSVGTSAFMVLFFIAYGYILKNPLHPFSVMPATAIDRLVPFSPIALPIYASLWLYVSLPPALIESRSSLIAYGMAAAAMCLAGLISFLIWPTAVPPADIDWALYPGFGILKSVDLTGNACPSLHAASAVFSCVWLDRQLRELGGNPLGRYLNALWCAAIVYSTIATRQHVALDALAGIALGVVAAILSRPFVSPVPR